MQKTSFIGLAVLLFLFPSISNAEADEGLADEDLPTVYVSATRSAQSAVSTPAQISIITRDEIEESGADHVVEILESRAGIQVQDLFGDGSRAKISMRGFGADNSAANVLVLVDGRRLNPTDLSAPDLNSISLKDVEQIEIINGSAGTLYGDQAVAGVVNIITRKPRKLTESVEVGGGSYRSGAVRAVIANRLSGGNSYRLSAELKSTDNYRRYNWQDYRNLSFNTRLPTKSGEFGIDYQVIDEYLQLPGALSAAQLAADRRQASYTTDYNDGLTNIARGTYRRRLGKNWNLETELTNRQAGIAGALYGANFDQQRQHWGLTPRLVGALPLSNGDALVTVGADIDKTDYAFVSPTWSIDTSSAQSMNAVYAQGIVPLNNRLELTLGARHAHATDTINDASAFPSGITLDKSATVTEFGIARKINRQWRLFFRRDGNLRFAKTDEHTFTEPGVTGLEAQTGVSYEAGAQWKHNRNRFSATLYQLDLDNEIDFDNTADGPWGPGTGANVNLDPTRRLGLNLEGRFQASPKVVVDAQYAFIDAVFRGGPYTGNAIPFVARHNVTVSARWRRTDSWQFLAEARAMSERFQGSDYDNSLPGLPALALVNIGARYSKGPWQVKFRVNNIGDVEYNGYASFNSYYPAPKRNFQVSGRYNF